MARDFREVKRRGGIYTEFTVDGLSAIEKEFMRMEKELRTQEGKNAMTSTMKPVMANVKGNIRRQGINRHRVPASVRENHQWTCEAARLGL
jgi:hypothetical protein